MKKVIVDERTINIKKSLEKNNHDIGKPPKLYPIKKYRLDLIEELVKVFPDTEFGKVNDILYINGLYGGSYSIQEQDINSYFVGCSWEEIQKMVGFVIEESKQ